MVVERFNRTMKTHMWRYFTANSTNVYLDVLPKPVDEYNNETKHRSIGMTPAQASMADNERLVPTTADRSPTTTTTREPPRFRLGDEVRLAVSKRHFEKGYTPNWTEEAFVVNEILSTSPTTYRVRDLMDEPIQGTFYEQQLQKTAQTKFRIEKILRRRRGQVLVKWKGYPDKFNSWHPASELEKL